MTEPGAGWSVAGPRGAVRVHRFGGGGLEDADFGDAGPVLLALHGWTDAGDVFAPLAARLRTPCTVIAPDAPAHGGTPLREGDYLVADHADDAVAVLDAVTTGRPPRPVVVLGHSMGALTAARVAARRPDVVGHLVLEDPARSAGHRPGSPRRMQAWVEGLRSGGVAGSTAWVAGEHPSWPPEELPSWVASKLSVDLAHLSRRMDWGEPLVALLAEVAAPVTLVVGEQDRGGIVSPTAAQRCAATCRGGGRLVTLRAGHCPRREAPAEFAALVDAALLSTVQAARVTQAPKPPPRRRRSR